MLERTPLKLAEIAAESMSARRPMPTATKKKIQRAHRRRRHATARKQRQPATQRRRKRSHRINLSRNITTVGGRKVRRSQAKRERRRMNIKRKRARTGSYSPYRRSRGDDMDYESKVEAYEALVNYIRENRASF